MKTYEVLSHDTKAHYAWQVWCPACSEPRMFRGWTFNGDHERPTFSPSIIVRGVEGGLPGNDAPRPTVCHSYLRDGTWEYLPDCTHAMKGQRVPAPDWPGYVRGTMAETPAAQKAEADAKKAADDLAQRREADARRDADKADADAKAEQKAEQKADVAAKARAAKQKRDDEDAAEDRPRETDAERNRREHAGRRAAMEDYRAKGERIYTALRSSDVGLDDAAAANLTVHILETVEGGEHMGATEVVHWVHSFQHQNPVAWPAIRNAHMPQFQAAMERCNVRTLPSEELEMRAAAVRMQKQPGI